MTNTPARALHVAAVLAVALTGTATAAQPLTEGDYTAPAKLETATFIGSEGSEYLATGVFLLDGRIMIAGVSQDPEIELHGVTAKVIGRDAEPFPVVGQWKPLGRIDTGIIARPKLGGIDDALDELDLGELDGDLRTDEEIAAEKRRQEEEAKLIASIPKGMKWKLTDEADVESAEMYRKMTWLDRESTAFWGVFSPDLTAVGGLWRLPRGAGSVTSAGIAADGTVYITGGACNRIESVTSDVGHLPAVTEDVAPPASFMLPLVYLVRLSPDLSRVAWLRTMPCEEYAPRLRVLRDGDVVVTSPDIRRFSPEGELKLSCAVTRSRYPDSVSINPVTGGWCKGGDFLTRTGREPWRTPYFFIMNADGTPHLELWRWRGPFAAIDGLGHLVADAQVAKTSYDEQGNLTVTSRSHGGNCVQIRYPYDIERMMPNGLGGIPANSPGCVVKLDADHNVVGAGVFSDPGFFGSVGHGIDGSVTLVIRGRCKPVGGLSELTSGQTVAIVSPDITARRFASVMPGCGKRLIIAGMDRPEDWGTVTGFSQGRPKLLFLSGAVASEKINGKVHGTPLRNAVQEKYAGGRLDGYAMLFDLSPGPPKTVTPKRELPTDQKRVREGPPPVVPAEGQRFEMGGERYATVHLSIREEPEAELWPRFYYGGAEPGGGFTYATGENARGAFTLRADHLEQHDYNQDRRVFGSRLKMIKIPDPARPGKTKKIPDPKIRFEVTKMSPWKMVPKSQERKNDIRVTQQPTTMVSGTLYFGDHQVAVEDAPCTARFQIPRKVDKTRPGVWPNLAIMHIRFTLTGGQLGFTHAEIADRQYRVVFSCTGSTNIEYDEFKEYVPPPLKETDVDPDAGESELDDLTLEP